MTITSEDKSQKSEAKEEEHVKPKIVMPDFSESSAIFAQHYSILRDL